MDNAALLVVDVINRFDFKGGDRLADRTLEVVPSILDLRRAFDAAQRPVIYANDNFTHWHGDFRELVATCRKAGGRAAEIAGQLAPEPAHYYMLKPRHSAFLGTPLHLLLDELKVSTLVITGLATDACVLASAQEAHMRQFDVHVPSDACAAQTNARHAQALSVLRTGFQVDTRPSAFVIEALARKA